MKLFLALTFVLASLLATSQELQKDPKDGCLTWEMNDGDTTWVMKQYFMVFYLSGEKQDQDSVTVANIQEGHLAHISKMGDDGYLSIAGPFGDKGDMRGILIFNVPELEKVKALMDEDPAVKANRLTYEIHPWWGAKGSTLN